MGHYTMLEGDFVLKPDTPVSVWDALEGMASLDSDETQAAWGGEHPLFSCDLVARMFRSTSAYLEDEYDRRCVVDREARTLSLGFDVKNYDDEIQHFLDFISPHLESVSNGAVMSDLQNKKTPIVFKDGQLTAGAWYPDVQVTHRR